MVQPTTVFHISDLHHSVENDDTRGDSSRAAAAAILRLAQRLKSAGHLSRESVVAFTGDLVQAAGPKTADPNCFDHVADNFLEPLRKLLDISPESIFIVPGNHDMQRGAVNADEFLNPHRPVSTAQIDNDLRAKLAAYLAFVSKYRYSSPDYASPRLKTFDLNGTTFCCFNGLVGAYSRSGLGDKGSLFAKDTEFADRLAGIPRHAVVLTHHPLSWYDDEVEHKFREFLAERRARLLTGHVHANSISEIATTAGGYVSLQAGAASEGASTDFVVGLHWLPNSNAAATRSYVLPQGGSDFDDPSIDSTKTLPMSSATYFASTAAFYDPQAICRAAVNAEKAAVDEIESVTGRSAECYVAPDLARHSAGQMTPYTSHVNEMLLEKGNVLVSGNELCGKSALLAYSCVVFNKDVALDEPVIGILVNFTDLKQSVDLRRTVIDRLCVHDLSRAEAAQILSSGKCRIFIDNVDTTDVSGGNKVFDALAASDIRWTAATRGGSVFNSAQAPAIVEGREVAYYQITELTIPTVEKMISLRPDLQSTGGDRKLVERVFKSAQNLNTPRNAYYVSRLLEVFAHNGSAEPLNRYLLIENIISEGLRQAHRLHFPGSALDVALLDSLVGAIAYGMYTRKRWSLPFVEVLQAVTKFGDDKGIQPKRFQAELILDLLFDARVLRRHGHDVRFAISTYEDYFLAKHMSHDEEFASYAVSLEGVLALPGVVEFFIAQNPSDARRIADVMQHAANFVADVREFHDEIGADAREAIRTAAPSLGSEQIRQITADIEKQAGDDVFVVGVDQPRAPNDRIQYSIAEQGAVLLQLGASILGLTRTLDRDKRVDIFQRIKPVLVIVLTLMPIIAQRLADGSEIRVRGTVIKAERRGPLAKDEDRYYLLLRSMLYNALANFATWAGSNSFYSSAQDLRATETDELVKAALHAQNIEADLSEAVGDISSVLNTADSMVLREVLQYYYIDALTLVPLHREEQERAVAALADLASNIRPLGKLTSKDALARQKDALRRQYNEKIGYNTYIGKRVRTPSRRSS